MNDEIIGLLTRPRAANRNDLHYCADLNRRVLIMKDSQAARTGKSMEQIRFSMDPMRNMLREGGMG